MNKPVHIEGQGPKDLYGFIKEQGKKLAQSADDLIGPDEIIRKLNEAEDLNHLPESNHG